MELKKLDVLNKEELGFLEELYAKSFPLSERRPFSLMLDIYNQNSSFTILIAKYKEQVVGFLSYWDMDAILFAEHFAISIDVRNAGYGTRVFQKFMEKVNKPIILEVELPTTIMAERRIGFYQRIGFKLWEDILYQQPSYHNDENVVPMKLMTYGEVDLKKDLSEIRSKLYREVYNC